MGELIDLTQRLADRSRSVPHIQPVFFFDLACPLSYLASERVERLLGDVEWIPTAPLSELGGAALAEAERQAHALRLPLVWPERVPLAFPRAQRAAAFAADVGRASQFALAASRLAFCGGYDLEDPEILAEAAAAAGIGPLIVLEAAEDPSWDEQLEATASGLKRRGVTKLPAVHLGLQWRYGERAVVEAATLVAARSAGDEAISRV